MENAGRNKGGKCEKENDEETEEKPRMRRKCKGILWRRIYPQLVIVMMNMVAQSTTQDDLFGFEPRVTTSVFDALSCCSTIESPAPVTDLVSRGKKLVHDCRPITALCEIYTTTSVIRPCSFPSPHATHAPLRTTLLPHDPSRPYPDYSDTEVQGSVSTSKLEISSTKETVKVNHGEARCNGRTARQLYEERFPHHQVPSHTFFTKVYQRASEMGTSTANRSDCGAPRQQRIGRGSPIAWFARSSDLTPLDYFLWGHMKRLIYETPCWRELWLRRMLDYQVLAIVCTRTWYVGTVCVEVTGRHIEPFLQVDPEEKQRTIRSRSEKVHHIW
ncbi:hypothetical protein ANN_11548 [Periplaneta americana]|uniref:Uncharacterized protein n=1 Tax=Periplaneta americana TaxID=6978 RepID=A0ABQ8T7L9_PERAM|nr:hypothetical protein ANN_11548 [Periplaneta americana]